MFVDLENWSCRKELYRQYRHVDIFVFMVTFQQSIILDVHVCNQANGAWWVTIPLWLYLLTMEYAIMSLCDDLHDTQAT